MKQFFVILCLFWSSFISADELDLKLNVIKKLYELTPKECGDIRFRDASDDEVHLGKLLFESKALSGNDDIACINCHLDEFNITDGLPLAIGVDGIGKGMDRMDHGMGAIVARNAISLIGVGHKSFNQFFWDGKVGLGDDGNIYSQLGTDMSNKFSNALAVATVMPLLERDELIGTNNIFSNNDISRAVDEKLYTDKFNAVSEVIVNKFKSNSPDTKEINELAQKLGIEEMDLITIGSLLGSFIANEFQPKQWKSIAKCKNGSAQIKVNTIANGHQMSSPGGIQKMEISKCKRMLCKSNCLTCKCEYSHFLKLTFLPMDSGK